jgi:ParB family chromosome partitioning protein
MSTTYELIPIASVRVPEGRRALRNVEQLANSIREVGLLNPITVTQGHMLIAGYHRLEAVKSLGHETIAAIVSDEPGQDGLLWALAEIDENLVRNDLGPLERGVELAKRKTFYEKLHPETVSVTVRGGPGRGKTNAESAHVSFAADTVQKTGLSRRVIEEEVQIASILPEVQEVIRDTEIADSKTDLLAIARMDHDEQRAVAARVKSAEPGKAKAAARRVRAEQQAQRLPEPVPQEPRGDYQVVLADLPWESSAEREAMPLEELCLLPVGNIAAKDCVLFLWTTGPGAKDAIRVLDCWGFTYRTCAVWTGAPSHTGDYLQERHGLLLVATKGSPLTPTDEARPDSVQESLRGTEHELIEAMYPTAKRIELFANQRRDGWSRWGDHTN